MDCKVLLQIPSTKTNMMYLTVCWQIVQSIYISKIWYLIFNFTQSPLPYPEPDEVNEFVKN